MPDEQPDSATEPEHLPGLEPDDPDYLPGLEPDEPQSVGSTLPKQPDPAPRSELPASASTGQPERHGDGKWTNEELDKWWDQEGGETRYDEARSHLRFGQSWREKTQFGKTVDWIDEEYKGMEETDLDDHLPEEQRSDEARLSEAFLSGEGKFSGLAPYEKAAIRDSVDELDSTAVNSGPSKWAEPLISMGVTLPDGREATIETDPSSRRQRIIDGDGNRGEWQDIEPIPDDPKPPPTEKTPATEPTSQIGAQIGGLPRGLVLGVGGGIFALVMLGLVFVFSGGGGASGPWSVTDPQGDFVPTFSDGRAIENPSAAGDVTSLDVAVADGNTTVTVNFAGPAEGLMTEGGEELAAALQFIPVGDERWIDILFNEDGSVKISDAPSGSRITATWSAANVLVFEITGVTPASGATVRFATIQRDGFAHSTDEVSLATGGADAVVAPRS